MQCSILCGCDCYGRSIPSAFDFSVIKLWESNFSKSLLVRLILRRLMLPSLLRYCNWPSLDVSVNLYFHVLPFEVQLHFFFSHCYCLFFWILLLFLLLLCYLFLFGCYLFLLINKLKTIKRRDSPSLPCASKANNYRRLLPGMR